MLKLHTFLTEAERDRLNEKGIADGYWRDDPRVLKPGTMWYTPWIFDPNDPVDEARRTSALARIANGTYKGSMLSEFYWKDWSHVRPPACVVCPNGKMWIIDQVATNGKGWKITGEGLNITATPSIVVPGYHGYLRNGVFTDDLDGRGPLGIAQPIEERKTT